MKEQSPDQQDQTTVALSRPAQRGRGFVTVLTSLISLSLAGVSSFIAFRASEQAQLANRLALDANRIQDAAVGEFADANHIAMIASIREASVKARMLLEQPQFSVAGMDFSYLRFSTYRFPAKDLRRADFSHCNLSFAEFPSGKLGGALFNKANLWGARLLGAEAWGAQFKDADLRDCHLKGANLRGSNFEKARLKGTDLSGADLRGACFDDAVFGVNEVQNLRFKGEGGEGGAAVWARRQIPTDLRGADLRGATFERCALQNVRYDAQTRWPEGFSPPPSWQPNDQGGLRVKKS